MLGCEKISGLAKPWSEGVLGEIGKNFRDVPWEVLGGSGEIDSEPPLRQRWQANFLPHPTPTPPARARRFPRVAREHLERDSRGHSSDQRRPATAMRLLCERVAIIRRGGLLPR